MTDPHAGREQRLEVFITRRYRTSPARVAAHMVVAEAEAVIDAEASRIQLAEWRGSEVTD